MQIGWIKLHRQILDHWTWLDKKNIWRRSAWIYFIIRANHKQTIIPIGNQLMTIAKGAFITSIDNLAFEFGVSSFKIKTFIKMLQKDEMITVKTTNKFTYITICNYETYQETPQTEQEQTKNN